jgi:putative membrane protein insertion efficiency factor
MTTGPELDSGQGHAHEHTRGPEPLNGDAGSTRAARLVATAPIVAYQRLLAPALPRRCRYEPTCSHYAVQAIREYGILKGLVLAGWRLLRCNPLSPGGFDPVRAQRLFRQPPRLTGADAGHPST